MDYINSANIQLWKIFIFFTTSQHYRLKFRRQQDLRKISKFNFFVWSSFYLFVHSLTYFSHPRLVDIFCKTSIIKRKNECIHTQSKLCLHLFMCWIMHIICCIMCKLFVDDNQAEQIEWRLHHRSIFDKNFWGKV